MKEFEIVVYINKVFVRITPFEWYLWPVQYRLIKEIRILCFKIMY